MADTEAKEGLKFWETRWVEGRTKFHLLKPHFFLVENLHIISDPAKSTEQRFLVPLCGKSCDLIYLYEKGFAVVGVEISTIAIESFFNENNLSFKVAENNGFNVYVHDERLKIFQGDFFQFTSEIAGGKFDLHWDRGGLIALEPCSQQKYVDQLKLLLDENSKSLLESLEFNQKREAPPRSIFLEQLKELFGSKFVFTEVCRTSNEESGESVGGLLEFMHVFYLIEQQV